MHIKRAKQEILDSIEAYLQKDEDGHYLIPVSYTHLTLPTTERV